MHETSRDVSNPCLALRRLRDVSETSQCMLALRWDVSETSQRRPCMPCMRRLETSHRTLYGSRLFCSKVGGRWAQRANADGVEADLRNGGCASKTFWSLFTAVFASKKKKKVSVWLMSRNFSRKYYTKSMTRRLVTGMVTERK